ncbi:MGMT family protein [Salinibius halmophilus]|uniref:MGMT family protein n=1 Tax=Salinibius halmophilus TaxID=1853216 RepID=UPI000E65F108|nr:MGMT family protein [Salinibius halmophilus]
MNTNEPTLDELIWQAVASIPVGKVATYGSIAKLCGYPNHARYVGRALKQLPKDSTLPWHRVINSQGKISFPVDSDKYLLQKHLLEAENVIFTNQKIRLKDYM